MTELRFEPSLFDCAARANDADRELGRPFAGSQRCALLLQQRFGPGVLCDVVALDADCEPLLAQEEQLVSRAVSSRRREFAAGRACARRLLTSLSFPTQPLLCAPNRMPLWPAGAIGSIAHDRSYCAVAVARAERLAALGLDVEPDEPLESDLWDTLFTRRERAVLDALPRAIRGRTARILFSAKECAYKCQFSLSKTALEFREMELELDLRRGRFRATVSHTRAVLEGFHLACAGSIFTGMALRSTSHQCLPRAAAG